MTTEKNMDELTSVYIQESREQLAGIPNPKVQAKAAEYLRELHDGMRDFRF